MAEYRRFIAYFYEYIDGKKHKSAGFAKVELRGGIWRILFHLNGGVLPEPPVQIYGFVRTEGYLLGLLMGTINTAQQSLEEWAYRADVPVGKEYRVEDLSGIWVQSSDGRIFLTVWDDEEIEPGKFVLELPQKEQEQNAGTTDRKKTGQNGAPMGEITENDWKEMERQPERGAEEQRASGISKAGQSGGVVTDKILLRGEQESAEELRDENRPETQESAEELRNEDRPETQESAERLRNEDRPETQESVERLRNEDRPETWETAEAYRNEGQPEMRKTAEAYRNEEQPEMRETAEAYRNEEQLEMRETAEAYRNERQPEMRENAEVYRNEGQPEMRKTAEACRNEGQPEMQGAAAVSRKERPEAMETEPLQAAETPQMYAREERDAGRSENTDIQALFRTRPRCQPFRDGEITGCVMLRPCDIVWLQQRGWQVGRSSFLQHGFYQYRHLLLGAAGDGSYIIGVPGVYNPQEKYMAGMFGFERFKESGARRNNAVFGYWYRKLERRI